MESEQSAEVVSENEKPSAFQTLRTVTPLSKYLTMFLFVILPFLGGWIGYTLAPVTLTDTEIIVVKEPKLITRDGNELDDNEVIRNAYVTEPLELVRNFECVDSALLYYDETGTRSIIEESLSEVVQPILGEERKFCDDKLVLLTFLEEEDKVFLRADTRNLGSGNIDGVIYEYDTGTNTIREMDINKDIGSIRILSPDNTKIAAFKNSSAPVQEMLLADLLTDTSRKLLDLDDESLTLSPGDAWSFLYRYFFWIDNKKINYAVWDATQNDGLVNLLKETHIIDLSLEIDSFEPDIVDQDETETQKEFTIVSGACGTLRFRENLGNTFKEALDVLERRHFEKWKKWENDREIRLEIRDEIIVEDFMRSSEKFQSIIILYENGGIAQSVVDVIDSRGNLYSIEWCPD